MQKKIANKKVFIAVFIVLLIAAIIAAISFLLWYVPWPNREMPVMTFAYNDKANDIYLFDSKGNIYAIDRDSKKTNQLAWVDEVVAALEKNQTTDWMQLVGKTDVKELQKQYNIFCKVTSNPNFNVHGTVKEIPAVEPNTEYTTPKEYWYGYLNNNGKYELKVLFLEGYLEYEATDKRADKIADWIEKEASKYKINHAK